MSKPEYTLKLEVMPFLGATIAPVDLALVKPMVTQVEGPYNDNDELLEDAEFGETYYYYATLNVDAQKVNPKEVKWAVAYDTEKYEKQYYLFPGKEVKNDKVRISISIGGSEEVKGKIKEKFKIYAYTGVNPDTEVFANVSIQEKKTNIYFLFYTQGNDRGDEMFRAAALTRKYDIENSSGYNSKNDTIIISSFKNVSKIIDKINATTSKNDFTKELSIWSHGATDGPVGTDNATSCPIDGDEKQMGLDCWDDINFNWVDQGNGGATNFFGCRTGLLEGKSFAKNISNLTNFKNVKVSGQTSSSFPSQYVNYRENSENGADNFINSEKNNKINIQITYLVSGKRKAKDWNLNEQNDAYKMQVNKNGVSIGAKYQKGKKR